MNIENLTVIGPKTKFNGNAELKQSIQIDGIYEGELSTDEDITVGKDGYINGTFTCKNLTVYGNGDGNVTCTGVLTVIPGGSFKGEVNAANLHVTEGATLDGTIHMLHL